MIRKQLSCGRIMAVLMALGCALDVRGEAGALLVNPGFEAVAKGGAVPGWGWLPAACRIEARDGVNGTRAFVFESDEPAKLVFMTQLVRLVPGRRYRYSVMIKGENLWNRERKAKEGMYDGGGAGVAFEYFDKDGKWCGGHYDDNYHGGKAQWRRIGGLTPPVPMRAVTMRFGPIVCERNSGKVCFDDLEVEEFVERPVEAIYSSAYRNLVADGETVRIAAALNVRTNETPLAGLAATFAIRARQGEVRKIAAAGLRADAAGVRISSADLAVGENEVTFELKRGNVSLGTASMTLTRVRRRPDHPVWFDEDGRTIVNGQPFFPLGVFTQVPTDKDLETLEKSPFNCILPYPELRRADLDRVAGHGLKVIYSVKDGFAGVAWSEIKDEKDEEPWVKRKIEARKDHPAILAWYFNDEYSPLMIDRLSRRRAFIERLDPGHPTYSVLYQHQDIRRYLPSLEAVGTDLYPVPDHKLSMSATWTRDTREGSLGLRPIWQVPQIFDWAAYKPARSKRPPTLFEMRSMAWQCIACGANGLVFYSHFDLARKVNGSTFDSRWPDVCAMGEEIRRLTPVMLSVEDPGKFVSRDRRLAVRAWKHQGAAYLLVVNVSDEDCESEVDVPRPYGAVETVFGPSVCGEGTGSLKVRLKSYEPALYRLPDVHVSKR